jgi:hypothetical protein
MAVAFIIYSLLKIKDWRQRSNYYQTIDEIKKGKENNDKPRGFEKYS